MKKISKFIKACSHEANYIFYRQCPSSDYRTVNKFLLMFSEKEYYEYVIKRKSKTA